ncbi:hypothetical protein ColTof3_00668 [Colletotrichum tofieldiae]|nr:hypothetical protein ColTof3_00668 [Colletotrichum tofieldiae]
MADSDTLEAGMLHREYWTEAPVMSKSFPIVALSRPFDCSPSCFEPQLRIIASYYSRCAIAGF